MNMNVPKLSWAWIFPRILSCRGSLCGLNTEGSTHPYSSKSSANLRKLLGGSGEELGQGPLVGA